MSSPVCDGAAAGDLEADGAGAVEVEAFECRGRLRLRVLRYNKHEMLCVACRSLFAVVVFGA